MLKLKGLGVTPRPFFNNLNYIKMARIILGAIITDMQGSIGGTTFRRSPRGLMMYNKQGTQIKSAFAPASRKNQLGNIFAEWQNLDPAEQTYWGEQSSLYPQKNKFGQDVILTGRQFFTKLSAQMLPSGELLQVTPLDDRLCPAITTLGNISLDDNEIMLNFDTAVDDFYVYVSCYPLRKGSRVKPHAHFKKTYHKKVAGAYEVNIFDYFMGQFPYANAGEKYGANIQFCSFSGFLTSVQALEIILES